MARIVSKINLGMRMQQVFIENEKYDNKKTVETYWIPLSDFASFISKYTDVADAYLSGPPTYLDKIEKETKEIEMQKYSKQITTFHRI